MDNRETNKQSVTKFDDDAEATDAELKGVVYTGVTFIVLLFTLIGGCVYWAS